MDIFGITLTETQVWLLGAAGAAIGLFITTRQSRIQRLAEAVAAHKYRLWVPWLRRKAFDSAVQEYEQACQEAGEYDSVPAYTASESTDWAKEKRKKLDDAVHKLYSYGKRT